jgi:hypothetical protein
MTATRIRGWHLGVASALATLGLAPAVSAQTATVTISSSPAEIGNLVLATSTASVKLAAGTGAVSFTSGVGARARINGGALSAPTQLVTITCNGGNGAPNRCNNTRFVRISQTAVTGRAQSIATFNISNVQRVGSLANTTLTLTTLISEAASGSQFIKVEPSGFVNNQNYTFTFNIGSTAVVQRTGGAAQWTYTVSFEP